MPPEPVLFHPAQSSEPEGPSLRAVTIHEFLATELPPRENVLAPWLPTQGLAMIYAKRGIGKTHLGLGIFYAVASGGRFLKWEAPKPRPVLYVDGEMPAVALQERIAAIVKATDIEPPAPEYLKLITPDLQERGIPDIGCVEGQEAIEEHLEGIKLVILDNLSTLLRQGRENEAESWNPVQEWALSLRRKGISVLFIHHAGKGGQQRGTSRREDVLDTVICLRHPSDYSPPDGCRVEVHFEKARGIQGDELHPFEAKLEYRDGEALWTTRDLEECRTGQVAELSNLGMNQRDIAKELEIGLGSVNRHLQKAREMGLITT